MSFIISFIVLVLILTFAATLLNKPLRKLKQGFKKFIQKSFEEEK